MFGWFKSEQRDKRRKVRLDRKHLESRALRFLTNYLAADETRKPQFYRAVEAASEKCRSTTISEPSFDLEDAHIAEATSNAAMKMVLAREGRVPDQDDRIAAFVTDAYATVAVAYHRAAGVYVNDREMQELGTAAVHLLTMATSFMMVLKD